METPLISSPCISEKIVSTICPVRLTFSKAVRDVVVCCADPVPKPILKRVLETGIYKASGLLKYGNVIYIQFFSVLLLKRGELNGTLFHS